MDFTSYPNRNLPFLQPPPPKCCTPFSEREKVEEVHNATVQHHNALPLTLSRIAVLLGNRTGLLLGLNFITWMWQLRLVTSHPFSFLLHTLIDYLFSAYNWSITFKKEQREQILLLRWCVMLPAAAEQSPSAFLQDLLAELSPSPSCLSCFLLQFSFFFPLILFTSCPSLPSFASGTLRTTIPRVPINLFALQISDSKAGVGTQPGIGEDPDLHSGLPQPNSDMPERGRYSWFSASHLLTWEVHFRTLIFL